MPIFVTQARHYLTILVFVWLVEGFYSNIVVARSHLTADKKESNPKTLDGDCRLSYSWGSWKPYQYYDQNGNLVGSQIQFAKLIASKLGCKVEFREMLFTETLRTLQSGELDFTGHATPTEDRKEYAYFSDTYTSDYLALYVRSDVLNQYQDKDLKHMFSRGFKLGVTQGHFYGDKFASLRNSPRYRESIVETADSYDLYQLLMDKKIDGFLDSALIAGFALRDKKLDSMIKRHPSIYFDNPLSFMFSKKNIKPEMVKRVNEIIKELKKDPGYAKRWHFQ